MPKTLVVADIHEDWHYVQLAEERAVTADRVICLGDYWDSWDGVTENTHLITNWVKAKLSDQKWTMLWGNHDIHYAFPIQQLLSSGYSDIRQQIITPLFNNQDWNKFRFHIFVDDWLLTHAGVASKEFGPGQFDLVEQSAKDSLSRGMMHPWYEAGRSRGGFAKLGGLTWADWSEAKVLGVNQLCGHTEAREIRVKVGDMGDAGFRSVCMDTQRRHFGWIEDGELTFEQVRK